MTKTTRKLALDTGLGFNVPFERTVKAIKDAGFDGCFTGCAPDGSDIAEKAKIIAENGLVYQSVHSPFGNVYKIWEDVGDGEKEIDLLIKCVNACADAGVPIIIIHPIIGMDRHNPTDIGTRRFARLVEAAEKAKVKLAFENVENLEYLDKIFADLGQSDAVRLCWDTGHEMCYNFSIDIPGRFAGKLVCTHFDDNLGIADKNVVTWLDDLHLMPFDGIADWKGIMDRIRRENYEDFLTFELTRNSKPGKNTHDIYAALTVEEFAALAYDRAVKVALL